MSFLIWKELGMGKKFPHEWLSRNSERVFLHKGRISSAIWLVAVKGLDGNSIFSLNL